jgi:hypothetical protein
LFSPDKIIKVDNTPPEISNISESQQGGIVKITATLKDPLINQVASGLDETSIPTIEDIDGNRNMTFSYTRINDFEGTIEASYVKDGLASPFSVLAIKDQLALNTYNLANSGIQDKKGNSKSTTSRCFEIDGLCKKYCEPTLPPKITLFNSNFQYLIGNEDYGIISVYDDRIGPDLTFVVAPSKDTVNNNDLTGSTKQKVSQEYYSIRNNPSLDGTLYPDQANGKFKITVDTGEKRSPSSTEPKNNLIDIANCGGDSQKCYEGISRKESGADQNQGNNNSFILQPKNGLIGDTDFINTVKEPIQKYYEANKSDQIDSNGKDLKGNYSYDIYNVFVLSVDLHKIWNDFKCNNLKTPQKISIKMTQNSKPIELHIFFDTKKNIWVITP